MGLPGTLLVLGAQAVPAQLQVLVVEVDVRPAQAERFALPQSERQGEHPTRAVPALAGFEQQALHLFHGVRFYLCFVLLHPRRLRQCASVPRRVAAPDRLPQRGSGGAVGLVSRNGALGSKARGTDDPMEILRLAPQGGECGLRAIEDELTKVEVSAVRLAGLPVEGAVAALEAARTSGRKVASSATTRRRASERS